MIVDYCKFSRCHSTVRGGALILGGTNSSSRTSVQLKNSLFHACWSEEAAGAFCTGGSATNTSVGWNSDTMGEGPYLEGLCIQNCYSTRRPIEAGSATNSVSNRQKAKYITGLNCGLNTGEDVPAIQWGVNGIEAEHMNYTSTENRYEIPFAWMFIKGNVQRDTKIMFINVQGVSAKAMLGGYAQGNLYWQTGNMSFQYINIYKCTVPSSGGIFMVGSSTGLGVTTISHCNIYNCGDYSLIVPWELADTYVITDCKSDKQALGEWQVTVDENYVPFEVTGQPDLRGDRCVLPATDDFSMSDAFDSSSVFTASSVLTASSVFTASSGFLMSSDFTESSVFDAVHTSGGETSHSTSALLPTNEQARTKNGAGESVSSEPRNKEGGMSPGAIAGTASASVAVVSGATTAAFWRKIAEFFSGLREAVEKVENAVEERGDEEEEKGEKEKKKEQKDSDDEDDEVFILDEEDRSFGSSESTSTP